jgi:hypothetical protein
MSTFTVTCTQDQLNKLLTKLTNNGVMVNVNSQSGKTVNEIDGHGVEATYTLDGNVLTVVVIKKPFFISVSHIQKALAEDLAKITSV